MNNIVINFYEAVFRQIIMDNHVASKPVTLQQALQNLLQSEKDAEQEIQYAYTQVQREFDTQTLFGEDSAS